MSVTYAREQTRGPNIARTHRRPGGRRRHRAALLLRRDRAARRRRTHERHGRHRRRYQPPRQPRRHQARPRPLASEQDRAAARALIGKVTTKGRGPKTGYARDRFGYAWMDTADGVPLARNGCDTRNDLLKLHGRHVQFRSGSDCVVVAMDLYDPYTGTVIDWRKQKAAAVQIDHVIPLSYGWQMGAAHWDRAKRQQLANDPLNLLPVEGRANSSKSDSGPASWLPRTSGSAARMPYGSRRWRSSTNCR